MLQLHSQGYRYRIQIQGTRRYLLRTMSSFSLRNCTQPALVVSLTMYPLQTDMYDCRQTQRPEIPSPHLMCVCVCNYIHTYIHAYSYMYVCAKKQTYVYMYVYTVSIYIRSLYMTHLNSAIASWESLLYTDVGPCRWEVSGAIRNVTVLGSRLGKPAQVKEGLHKGTACEACMCE